jgi:hypothetical protein
MVIGLSFSPDFWPSEGIPEERGKYTYVKYTCQQRNKTDYSNNDSGGPGQAQQSPGDQCCSCNNSGDPASFGSHEFN